jgi:hypothetical protein
MTRQVSHTWKHSGYLIFNADLRRPQRGSDHIVKAEWDRPRGQLREKVLAHTWVLRVLPEQCWQILHGQRNPRLLEKIRLISPRHGFHIHPARERSRSRSPPRL